MATKGKEAKREMRSEGEEEEEKWVTHYSSNHQILLVGEGDFSFSCSLAIAFGSASNICATSLDSYDTLIKQYKKARSNLENLEKLGASLIHGVDATRMKLHTDLAKRKFDRVIFNFPHAGFYGREDNALMIDMHRKIVRGFFRNASAMLRANGEIHVNHKRSAPFCHWNLEKLASENSVALIQCVDFNKEDYPGYQNKRGNGSRCDEPFHLGKSSTYIFGLVCHRGKKVSRETISRGSLRIKSRQFQNSPTQLQLQPTSSEFYYAQRNHIINPNPLPVGLPPGIPERSHYSRVFDGNLTCPTQLQLQPTSSDFNYAHRNHTINRNPLPVGLPPRIPERNHYSRVFDGNLTCRMNCYDVPGPGRMSFNRSDVPSSGLERTSFHHYDLPPYSGPERLSFNLERMSSKFNCYDVCPERLSFNYDASRNVLGEMRHGLERQKVEVPRTWNGDLHYLDELELRHSSNLRSTLRSQVIACANSTS